MGKVPHDQRAACLIDVVGTNALESLKDSVGNAIRDAVDELLEYRSQSVAAHDTEPCCCCAVSSRGLIELGPPEFLCPFRKEYCRPETVSSESLLSELHVFLLSVAQMGEHIATFRKM